MNAELNLNVPLRFDMEIGYSWGTLINVTPPNFKDMKNVLMKLKQSRIISSQQ